MNILPINSFSPKTYERKNGHINSNNNPAFEINKNNSVNADTVSFTGIPKLPKSSITKEITTNKGYTFVKFRSKDGRLLESIEYLTKQLKRGLLTPLSRNRYFKDGTKEVREYFEDGRVFRINRFVPSSAESPKNQNMSVTYFPGQFISKRVNTYHPYKPQLVESVRYSNKSVNGKPVVSQ